MTNRVAVMDLGTNTFHLLIADPHSHHFFTEVVHEYKGVKLGEGGINEGTIKPDAYQRGLEALQGFSKLINDHGIQNVKAIATSALRSASNGQQFIDDVRQQTGIQIETINGNREATYIYEGVKASGCLQSNNSLIVDIGGGSVEFIIGNQSQVLYKQSFEIGAARLMAKFHKTDPISIDEVVALDDYLDEQLAPMYAAVKQHPVNNLVGSSGAFETFAELVETEKGYTFDLKQTPTYTFQEGDLLSITNTIIHSTHQERVNRPGIIPVRVDMIVVASALTQHLMKRLDIHQVTMSAYSLKEGVLAELFKTI